MHNDIVQSLNRALLSQGWLYGEKLQRLGNPFIWVDGDNTPSLYAVQGLRSFMQYLTMFYEEYPTPARIMTPDFKDMAEYIEDRLTRAYGHFFPFLEKDVFDAKKNIRCMALVRAQDYAAIRSYCGGFKSGINHLDIGPGLGGHAVYTLKNPESRYFGLEASPHSYAIQRIFFSFLCQDKPEYLDLVECDNFAIDNKKIETLVNEDPRFRIKHVPSWHFGLVRETTVDLITATWVLNEVNVAGIMWLLSQVSRVLKKRGYFYIRDSAKLKPMRHPVDYDNLLTKMGFTETERLEVKNRVDFYGIPRVYQKKTDDVFSFDDLVKMCVGNFAVIAHGGAYMQNLNDMAKRRR